MNIYKSVFGYYCPRCRTGKLFIEPMKITQPLNMHKQCSHCNQHFEPEPGFYYGAMFVSYIISSIILVSLALYLVFGLGWEFSSVQLVIIIILLFTFLKMVRLSRSIWIHLMVKYKPQ